MDFKYAQSRIIVQIFIAIIMLFVSACGSSNTSNNSTTETGELDFSVIYHGFSGDTRMQAAVIDCTTEGVSTVEASVYDPDGIFLVGGGPWDCDAGQGTIAAVPAGSGRIIVILGMDSEGFIVFRGQKSDIQVDADNDNDAGTIDCYGFVPSLQAPVDEAVVNADEIGLAWNAVAGAIKYQVVVSENGNLSDPLINESTADQSYAPAGLSKGQTYYWQIFASDAFDHNGTGSKVRSFAIDDGHTNTPPNVQITNPDNGSEFISSDTITFTGSANDNEDPEISVDSMIWRLNENLQIGTGTSCEHGSWSVGSHQVTLTATDSEGSSATAGITIIINQAPVNNPPTAQITRPVERTTFSVEEAILFTGKGNDNEDGALSGRSLIWSSDIDEDIGISESFTSTTLSEGTHHITLTAIDSEGLEGMDTIAIIIASEKLPDTGQVISYTDTHGEDSDYTINPPSYTKLDSTGKDLDADAIIWAMVRDNVTGLVWEVKTNDGSGHDTQNTYSWLAAKSFIKTLNTNKFGGCSDWRLPTVKELSYLVHRDNEAPAINTKYFPHTGTYDNWFWTPITASHNSDRAWATSFYQGSSSNFSKSDEKLVRAVRGKHFDNNFVDNNDGTVTDIATGLMWQKAAHNIRTDWETALSHCATLDLAGYDDWRLPNVTELQSIVVYGGEDGKPAIDGEMFPSTAPGWHWSSTSLRTDTDFKAAWAVSFHTGSIGAWGKSDDYDCYTRAVRGWK